MLNLEEKQEIESLSSPSERCARLLSILRRKTQKQYEIFVEALIASNQSHVASVLKLGSFSISVMKTAATFHGLIDTIVKYGADMYQTEERICR